MKVARITIHLGIRWDEPGVIPNAMSEINTLLKGVLFESLEHIMTTVEEVDAT